MKNSSGKLVISAIVAVALAAAGTSWWFRYNATRRTAQFWEPIAAQLIRDAPVVRLWRFEPPTNLATLNQSAATYTLFDPQNSRDISNAHGLIHLRNALLDDRSYGWPPQDPNPGIRWEWAMKFRSLDEADVVTLIFSSDAKFVMTFDHTREALSCEPIAAGLAEVFSEYLQPPASSR